MLKDQTAGEAVIPMYPLKFLPVYKNRIWGGDRLKTLLGRTLPGSRIGESWELSSREDGVSVVKNGAFAGSTLPELMGQHHEQVMGSAFRPGDCFPLLHKMIDATDNLSVQVHPDDSDTAKLEHTAGKTEAWYILYASTKAKIIYGLKPGTSKDQFISAVNNDRIMEVVQHVPVAAGNLIYVPAGTVHALGKGIVAYEIQQNSDCTHRLYDYGRMDETGRPRQLHRRKAIGAVDFSRRLDYDFQRPSLQSPYFTIIRLRVEGQYRQNTGGKFVTVYVADGQGDVAGPQGVERITAGDTVFIPAGMGEFTINGTLQILLITLPAKPA